MTNDLRPVRCGCGGEAAVLVGYPNRKGQIYYRVKCWDCGTQTCHKRTREEAITAWNRAMGADTNSVVSVFSSEVKDARCSERTAKVREDATRLYCGECGERLDDYDDICGEPPIKYCPMCGARLEWG